MAKRLSEEDAEYLAALKKKRLAIVTGAQSYKIGSRSVMNPELKFLNDEIARLEGTHRPHFRRAVVTDK